MPATAPLVITRFSSIVGFIIVSNIQIQKLAALNLLCFLCGKFLMDTLFVYKNQIIFVESHIEAMNFDVY